MATTIVLDPGSGYFKSGLATSSSPLVYPSVVGHTKMSQELSIEKTFYGYDAIKRSCLLSLRYPIESGVIVSYDEFYHLLSIAFDKLKDKAPVESSNLIMSEAPLRPVKERQELVEHLFETVGISGLLLYPSVVLDLYSTGKRTGLVLDSGECLTSCLGIYEGIICTPSLVQMGFGGRDLNEKMQEMLHKKHGVNLITTAQREIARLVKEKHCEFLPDSAPTAKTDEIKEITLPDGNVLKMPLADLEEVIEMLFVPPPPSKVTKMSSDFRGFTNVLMQSVEKCDIDTRPSLLRNVVLAGGNTCFPNLPTRLKYEISKLVPVALKAEVDVFAEPNRIHAAWKGGSVIGQLSSTKEAMKGKKEYEEKGFHGLFGLI